MGTLTDREAGRPVTRARYGVLGFACSLALLTYLDRICISQAQDSIQSDLGFSDMGMALVFGAFTLGYLILEMPGGWMGERWGSRRAILGMVLAWSLFTALTGCVWHFEWNLGGSLSIGGSIVSLTFNSLILMLLIRFLFGISEAGTFPNISRVIRDWFPLAERGAALGWIWTFARLGGFFAPIFIAKLTVLLGWRQAFWIFGLGGIVWCLYFYWRFRDRPEDDPRCNEAERELIRSGSPASDATGHAWPSWRVLFRSPTIWAVCAASFFVNFGWWAIYPTWQPKYWSEVHGIADSSYLTGATFLCGAAGNLLGGWWSDRLLRRRVSRRWSRSIIGLVGYGLAGSCILATGFAATAWQAETLLCLGFLCNDLTVPIIWAVCTDIGGRSAGALSGLMNMVGGFAAVLSPILLRLVHGRLREHGFDHPIAWRIVLVGASVSWLVGAVSWLFIDAGKPISSEPEA